MPAFRVKLGANDLNCVDVPLNPTHSLSRKTLFFRKFKQKLKFTVFVGSKSLEIETFVFPVELQENVERFGVLSARTERGTQRILQTEHKTEYSTSTR